MQVRATAATFARILHAAALHAVVAAALAMAALTLLSALGVLPWLQLQASLGGQSLPQAGPIAQVALTLLLALMAAFVPASSRVLALERGHRDFRVSMEDVARAYHVAHAADRQGAFTMASQFDQVCERLDHLRQHPDLRLLEADVLTLAAQMSQQSHKLAEIYSDERVTRAKDVLAQRQQEVDSQRKRIAEAMAICREIMDWNARVELDEATVTTQIQQLDGQLAALLPALGYRRDPAPASHGPAAHAGNVVSLGQLPAAE
ncbi:DNA repair protein [Rubellimicrobium aerolatum]|uniref:DNA repair protein n=1 Tax=Rubellimicrobium aerolatum TaxID=490979 RepID=A0ABW0SBN7_9RHOB|nr:DNA repair protein [Rubellimicrobium aerolatum]MBP1805915.1 TolA-binding protein [Rubellimicrobium aerolatum]